MTFEEAKKLSRHPDAFHFMDKWMVKDSVSGRPLEGATTEKRAQLAADVCNAHEENKGRPRIYVVEAFTGD